MPGAVQTSYSNKKPKPENALVFATYSVTNKDYRDIRSYYKNFFKNDFEKYHLKRCEQLMARNYITKSIERMIYNIKTKRYRYPLINDNLIYPNCMPGIYI